MNIFEYLGFREDVEFFLSDAMTRFNLKDDTTFNPTNQRGYTTIGGAEQTVILNRDTWGAPIKYNIKSFIPDF